MLSSSHYYYGKADGCYAILVIVDKMGTASSGTSEMELFTRTLLLSPISDSSTRKDLAKNRLNSSYWPQLYKIG